MIATVVVVAFVVGGYQHRIDHHGGRDGRGRVRFESAIDANYNVPTLVRSMETFWKAGARILEERIAIFARLCRKTARRATPDNIHDLRVSARRLAAAQGVFPVEELGRLKKVASRIRKKLGQLRDLDVALENMRKLALQSDSSATQGQAYLTRLMSDRREILKKLRPMLWLPMPVVTVVVTADDHRRFVAEAPAHLLPQLQAIREVMPEVSRSDNAAPVHQLRICFKRLRYRLELFAEALGAHTDAWLSSCKRVQDRLGEIHDMDVLIGMLEGEWAKAVDGGSPGPEVESLLRAAWQERHRLNAAAQEALAEETRFVEEIQRSLSPDLAGN
ncbi:MAG: CHAD domain-containing protein [Acidobacteriota bacterium]